MGTLKDWRAQRELKTTLPVSGIDVKLNKVSLMDLISNGQIPQTLAAAADEIADKKAPSSISVVDIGKYTGVIDLVAKACLIEPPLHDDDELKRLIAEAGDGADAVKAEYGETHLRLDELPFDDRTWIFNWANKRATQLQPFSRQQAGGVGPVQPGRSVRVPTKRRH